MDNRASTRHTLKIWILSSMSIIFLTTTVRLDIYGLNTIMKRTKINSALSFIHVFKNYRCFIKFNILDAKTNFAIQIKNLKGSNHIDVLFHNWSMFYSKTQKSFPYHYDILAIYIIKTILHRIKSQIKILNLMYILL